MKIWVVVPDYGHEGYGYPERAFSTKEKAKEFVESLDLPFRWEIVERELDKK
jgi:hypothetical protein